MIFVTAQNEPTVMLMLAEKDLKTMRQGHTVFVDSRHTGGYRFDKVIVSLHASNEAALQAIRQAGHGDKIPAVLEPTKPRGQELECPDCAGVKSPGEMYRGKCIICWYQLAMKGLAQAN